ncbi:hypothetical protein ACH4JZ_05905 [Streptomyces sp. NPDC017615]
MAMSGYGAGGVRRGPWPVGYLVVVGEPAAAGLVLAWRVVVS